VVFILAPKAAKTSSTASTRKRVAKQSVIDEDDSLETIGRRLHTSAVPERLPCRDEQFDEVRNFVQSTLNNGSSRSLYISGIPGTGKTATVHQVSIPLHSSASPPLLNPLQVIRYLRNSGVHFEFVEVNGMRLTEPAQVYVEIFRQLAADNDVATRISARAARRHLNRMFETNDPARRPIVLLVDEVLHN
jgi:origin recognition complex subunit 1